MSVWGGSVVPSIHTPALQLTDWSLFNYLEVWKKSWGAEQHAAYVPPYFPELVHYTHMFFCHLYPFLFVGLSLDPSTMSSAFCHSPSKITLFCFLLGTKSKCKLTFHTTCCLYLALQRSVIFLESLLCPKWTMKMFYSRAR